MSLLAIKSLEKRFGGLTAINRLSMEIRPDEILALIGPNGAGKSTLINLITNYIKADSGEVLFSGQNTLGIPRHRIVELGIARTFQALTVYENLSIEDNITIGQSSRIKFSIRDIIRLKVHNGKKKLRDQSVLEKVESMMSFVNIERILKHQRVSTLSMLDRKRVAFATALSSEPKLLLLDEPLAGLNQSESHELLDLIRKTRGHGVTVLLIDHNLEAVMRIAERVLCLHFGTLIAEGTPSEIVNSKEVAEVYLGK
jgi:branched-chain amino acid transport system ATP-binding protein